MKRLRVVLHLLLAAGLLVSFGTAQAQDVLLNELLYFEDPSNPEQIRQHEWVEIFNNSDVSADVSGWAVSNRLGRSGPGSRLLPSVIIPPQKFLLVHFATGINDLTFTNGFATYYTGDPPGINLFNDQMDEMALYSTAQVVDFISWNAAESGYVPGQAHDDAVAAGQWIAGNFLRTDRLVHSLGERYREVIPGSSIGRGIDFTARPLPQAFDANGGKNAKDITPGRRNLDDLRLVDQPSGPAPGQKPWTVMLYLNGDNDMERDLFRNITQIEDTGGSDDGVNFVVMFDGKTMAQQFALGPLGVLIPIDGTRGKTWRFQIGRQVDTRYVRMLSHAGDNPFLGERNMGDPAELTGFINWAKTRYPAQRYALIFGSHGYGWKGFGPDETSGGRRDPWDALFMGEISTALNGQQFELIGFDACFMGEIEVAYQMRPFSRYFVASEEAENGFGWPYQLWVPGLKANSGWNGAQLGSRIVNDFHTYYTDRDRRHTLSLIDEQRLPDLVNVVSNFADDLRIGSDDFRTHDDPSDNVERRIAAQAAATLRMSNEKNAMDLHHFADLIKGDQTIPDCYKGQLPALLLLSARQGAVVLAEGHGDLSAQANGLTIYMPLKRTLPFPIPAAAKRDSPYDYPFFSRVSDGGSLQAMYAPNNDAIPLMANDPESGVALAAPAQWPLMPTPNFRFPADTRWDEFLLRFYHPVADNRILLAIDPDGNLIFPTVEYPECGNPMDEITVPVGSEVFFSGQGSSDADTPNQLPLHWMWDFDHASKGCDVCIAPYDRALDGRDAAGANDDVDADHTIDRALTNHEKEDDATLTSHVFNQVGIYLVTLNVWDDNLQFSQYGTGRPFRTHPIQQPCRR